LTTRIGRLTWGVVPVVYALAFSVPMLYLVAKAIGSPGIGALVGAGSTWLALWRSLQLAVWVTVLATVLGVGLAWLVQRTDVPARRVLSTLAMVPLVIPSFVGAHAYVSAFAPGGLLAQSLGWNNLPEVRGLPGAVFVLTLLSYPYVFVPVSASLAAMPPSLEECARLLGHRPLAIVRSIVLPQTASSIVAGASLVFLYAISDFGAVSFVRYDTLTRKIFEARLDPVRSVTFSLLLGSVALTAAVGSQVLARQFPPLPSAPLRRPLRYRLGRARWVAAAGAVVVLTAALAVPVGVMSWWTIRGRTSGGRRSAAVDLMDSTWGSAWIAVVAAALTVVVVMPMAYHLSRRAGWLSGAATTVMDAAFALPGIVIALALVRIFVGTSFYQSFVPLLVAYVLHFGAQALGAERVALARLSPRMREAAQMLGAGRWSRFRAIELPLIMPGIGAAGGLVLLSVLKELPATLMLRPIGFNTLATRINGTAEEALLIDAGELSLVLIALSGVLSYLLVVRRIGRD
jgi:iron(III) transport system permease protein